MSTTSPVIYREYRPKSDEGFVFRSWLETFRHATRLWPWFKGISDDVFFRSNRHFIRETLKGANVVVFCNPEDEDQIFGFLVFEKDETNLVLHYIYIKQSFRGFGFGKMLVHELLNQDPTLKVIYTAHTQHGNEFLRSLKLEHRPIFNPYWRHRHEISRSQSV